MAYEITVYCDICGSIGDAGPSLRTLHRELRRKGWERRHRRWLSTEILDICPRCLAESPAAVEEEIYGPIVAGKEEVA